MRQRTKVSGAIVGVFMVAVLIQSGMQEGSGVVPARVTSPETVSARAPSTPPPLPSGTAEPVITWAPETPDRVARVIDGDTFVLTDGRKVRVLGIDSCEMDTLEGKEAKATAEGLLLGLGGQVHLAKEPTAPDTDRWGRLLRYVLTQDFQDFGIRMVTYDHTTVFAGRNDASATYLARLREREGSVHTCTKTPAPTTEEHYAPVPDDDDDHHYVPAPRKSGGKSKLCRRSRWC